MENPKIKTSEKIDETKTTTETSINSGQNEAQKRIAQQEVIQGREQNKNNFEIVTEGTKSEVLNKIKSVIHLYIESEFHGLKIGNTPLTQEQKSNICLAITGKLLDSGIEDFFSSNIKEKVTKFQEYIKEQDWGKLIEDGFEEVDSEGEKGENKFETLIQKAIIGLTSPIKKAIESNHTDENKRKMLANPKYMQNYKDGDNLNNIPELQNNSITYLTNLRLKIKSLDEKLKNTEEVKEVAFDFIAHMPEKLQSFAKDFIKTLCSIPFVGDIVKTVFGIEGKDEDEIEVGLSKELKRRKSLKILREYGNQYKKDNGVGTPSKKSPGIDILEDKDLREVKSYKLKAFFVFCETNKINIEKKDFWEKIFSNQLKTADEKEVLIENIDEDKMFSIDKPNDSFYTTLNSIKIKETPKTGDTPSPVNNTDASKTGKKNNTSNLAPGVALAEEELRENGEISEATQDSEIHEIGGNKLEPTEESSHQKTSEELADMLYSGNFQFNQETGILKLNENRYEIKANIGPISGVLNITKKNQDFMTLSLNFGEEKHNKDISKDDFVKILERLKEENRISKTFEVGTTIKIKINLTIEKLS